MANIRVDSPIPVYEGQVITFRSPVDISHVTGLIVYYPNGINTDSKVFMFADAHGNNVGDLNLFASDAVVKVILDTATNMAFVQNADTNAYLEGELAKKYSPTNKPTAADVGAPTVGEMNSAIDSAVGKIGVHNTATDSHKDIRLLVSGLTDRLNALANSDDKTLDQMAEVVAYIKANRELIEQITTGKVSVSDIIDNLTTNASKKPLSASQGVVLKGLIDSLTTAMGGKLDASSLPEAVAIALAQAKESGEFNGKDGEDGTSVTHSWNGTVLTVVSASGTSSADLKGEKGDKGADGTVSFNDLTDEQKESMRGKSGVYVGSGTPDTDANVWVDPDGDPSGTENWVFTLEDGTTVTKTVVVI